MFQKGKRTVIINGISTPVDPDFRIMCEYSEALGTKDKKALCDIAERFFFAGLPCGVDHKSAFSAMSDFYMQGLAPGIALRERSPVGKSPEPCFDFKEDEGLFIAAFLSEYGIDLETEKLHWFRFCALFRGLSDGCRLKKIMSIRSEKLSDIRSDSERKRIGRLKKIFALKKKNSPRFNSAAERDDAMRAEIQSRLSRSKGGGG